ncbi:MAG: pilin [Patescibacteria group bacterium]
MRQIARKKPFFLCRLLPVACFAVFVGALFFSVLSLPEQAYAVCVETPPGSGIWMEGGKSCQSPCPPGKLCNPLRFPTIDAFLLEILKVVVQYGALIVVFFIVYAGFKFVTAQGNAEKLAEAKKMLAWVIVGAFVLLGVYVIREAICGTLNELRSGTGLPEVCPRNP